MQKIWNKKFDRFRKKVIIEIEDNRLRNQKKMTMLDIANELSVSKTTVSRAISGNGRIGRETRERVLQYIKAQGYTPNNIARGLASSKTYNIGVIIPDDKDGGDAPFFKSMIVGITEAAVKRDYDTVLVVVTDGNISGLERLVANRKVDGIVITRTDSSGKIIPYLESHSMPFILIGSDKNPDVLQIDSAQKEGCEKLIASLLEKGVRSIAYFAGIKKYKIESTRYEGFEAAFKKAKVPLRKDLVYWNSISELDAIVSDVIEKKIECIACSDDTICIKVMELLKLKKVAVPADVQVVSFFDSVQLEKNEIPVTAVHVDTRELSVRAGNLLIDSLNGSETEDGGVPVKSTSLDCSVLYRNSSR